MRELLSMLVGVVSLAVAAVVSAQEAAPASPEPGAIERNIEQGKAHIDHMHDMVAKGLEELEEARKSQNIQRMNCVNEPLTMMKGLVRLAQSNFMAMQECASRKDAVCSDHEFVKISIAFSKTEEFNGQLKGCGGPGLDSAIDGREFNIEKNIDPDLPDVDPTSGLNDLASKLDVPVAASPFLCIGPCPEEP